MAVSNMLCDDCKKIEVCKNYDILMKFDETAKKQLGINITMNSCENYDGFDSEEENVEE